MSNGKIELKTFQKVMEEQKALRKKLKDLIEDNRWLKDREERERYYSLVGWALVGVGTDEEYESEWKDFDFPVFFQSYQRFINKAGQISEEYNLIDDNGEPIYAEPKKVWKNVKDAFMDKVGMAQREAFRQSPEKDKRQGPQTKDY